jgi:hypothetical protein
MAQGVKLDSKTVERIQALRAAGIPVHRVAAALGVNPSTVVKHAPAGGNHKDR